MNLKTIMLVKEARHTEECEWYNSIYKKFQEIQNYSDRLVVARG